ncbi:hypothetical protein AB0E69_13345 [Kribbella sp. NPDC026611]|uniref:hypothetical protein n=1 Tax=Kribbella sp. NPDC026611 TaxID=3154911 RepID=UPI0033E733F4
MNETGSRTPEDNLRDALAPSGDIAPLDPALVIAGARRRRKVRNLTTAGAAAVLVAGIAAGGFLAGGRSVGEPPQPAQTVPHRSTPEPPTPSEQQSPTSQTPPHRPTPPTPNQTPAPNQTAAPPSQTSNPPRAQLTVPACVATVVDGGGPAPGPTATRRAQLSDGSGTTALIADSRYWTVCDNTVPPAVAARRPERLKRPSPQDTDAFAVAGDAIVGTAGMRAYYWAGGMVPAGVATIRYTFPDGATEDAVIQDGFWLLRHLSVKAEGGARVRVRLLSSSGALVNDFRLVPGTQTCAQVSHGC